MGPTSQEPPGPAPAAAGRRVLLAAVTALLVWACIEALCLAAFSGLRENGYDRAELSAQRRARQEVGSDGPLAGPDREAIHPYLGFVYDPDGDDPKRRAHHGGVPVSDYGFLDQAPPLRALAADGTVVVGIFGGSFAYFLSVHGVEQLLAGLRQAEPYRGRDFEVVRVALGGYKQPQQLLALTYLLSLGAHFDVVVNLDGFNEVALPVAENLPKGVFPFFPRNWSGRVGGIPDHAGLTAMVRIADLRRRRVAWAAALEASPLRHSVAANLVWWLRDHGAAVDISRAQVELAELASPPGYRVRGPGRDYPDVTALYEDLAAMWFRSSLAMHRLCDASGIAYWHFLQPNQYLQGSKPMGAAERATALAPPHFYQQQVELGYPRLRERGAELAAAGVRFHDLSGVFEAHAEPLYSDSCCHVNERGYRIVGNAMAERIAADVGAPPVEVPAE